VLAKKNLKDVRPASKVGIVLIFNFIFGLHITTLLNEYFEQSPAIAQFTYTWTMELTSLWSSKELKRMEQA
jgi:hypothetical protein